MKASVAIAPLRLSGRAGDGVRWPRQVRLTETLVALSGTKSLVTVKVAELPTVLRMLVIVQEAVPLAFNGMEAQAASFIM